MNFTNLANTFSVFGNFAVFDEESIALLNNLYKDCNINITNETSPEQMRQNKSGRMMQITNPKKHETIFMRPNRIDLQLPGGPNTKREDILNEAIETYKALYQIFEGSFATRIAYVGSYFTFDDTGVNMQAFASHIHLISYSDTPKELSIRMNNIENILNEDTNVVFNVNNVLIGQNTTPTDKRRALMITFDINTVASNQDDRFSLHELAPYFEAYFDLAKDKMEELSNID